MWRYIYKIPTALIKNVLKGPFDLLNWNMTSPDEQNWFIILTKKEEKNMIDLFASMYDFLWRRANLSINMA